MNAIFVNLNNVFNYHRNIDDNFSGKIDNLFK